MSNFETGATSAQSNNLALSVMNDGAVYPDRLHCGFAALQGSSHRLSFKDIVVAEANRQRQQGCTFKPQHITEAAKLVRDQTIQNCLELIRDNYDPSRRIEVSGRKWRDDINGNTYFSCWIQIPCNDLEYRQISVPYQYGYGEQWQFEAIRTIRAIGLFADTEERSMSRSDYPISFHFEGVMKKRDMYEGIYIK